MGPGMIFWFLVIAVLIILYVIHLRKCIKFFNSKIQNQNENSRNTTSLAIETQSPYTISNVHLINEVERGLDIPEIMGCPRCSQITLPSDRSRRVQKSVSFRLEHLKIQDEKNPPSYDEVIAQDQLKKSMTADSLNESAKA